jgi:hypothetical protein
MDAKKEKKVAGVAPTKPLPEIKLTSIKPNTRNPRSIKTDRFESLCKSIKEFPQMMFLRPIIVDADGIILGGNMRYEAVKALGYKTIPEAWVKKASDLSDEEKRRFIVIDNEGFGMWDWDILGADFDLDEVREWGLYVPDISDADIDDLFKDSGEDKPEVHRLVLEYDLERYEAVTAALDAQDGTHSEIVARLLGV